MRRFLFSLCMMIFLFASLTVYAMEIEPTTGIAVVEAENLNVRSGPSKDFDKLGTLSEGVSVEVKGYVDPDWYVIDFEGKDGYISSKYVTFTPKDEVEGGLEFVSKKYIVMGLVVAILVISGIIVYTFIHMKKEDEIPITDHDDTNMHMGEVTYDTYRLDIDPKFFEQTSVIPQPESIYDEKGDVFNGEKKVNVTAEADIHTLDSKLEQASAQIAALQKEVEQLKKQKSDTV